MKGRSSSRGPAGILLMQVDPRADDRPSSLAIVRDLDGGRTGRTAVRDEPCRHREAFQRRTSRSLVSAGARLPDHDRAPTLTPSSSARRGRRRTPASRAASSLGSRPTHRPASIVPPRTAVAACEWGGKSAPFGEKVMSETTAFLLLEGWFTLAALTFAVDELRILRRDERAARARAAAEIVPLRAASATTEPAPERRLARTPLKPPRGSCRRRPRRARGRAKAVGAPPALARYGR